MMGGCCFLNGDEEKTALCPKFCHMEQVNVCKAHTKQKSLQSIHIMLLLFIHFGCKWYIILSVLIWGGRGETHLACTERFGAFSAWLPTDEQADDRNPKVTLGLETFCWPRKKTNFGLRQFCFNQHARSEILCQQILLGKSTLQTHLENVLLSICKAI